MIRISMQKNSSETNPESPKIILEHTFKISQKERELQKNQEAFCIWFSGLSASGKSTLANELDKYLYEHNYHATILDSDTVRKGLCGDLGFRDEARTENIRRVAEVSKILTQAGLITICAFISPFEKDREFVKGLHKDGKCIIVHLDCPLAVCEKRDPKGMYKKARANLVYPFTGIHSPYEAPKHADLVLHTDTQTIKENLTTIVEYLKLKNFIKF
jgi:adenylylsulfate kinase